MSDQLEMKAVLDRAKIPTANVETELKCLVKIWPSLELRKLETKPLKTSICLVFDCSASMLQDNKLDTAIESAKLIVDMISVSQRVSLVAFQSRVRVLIADAEASEAGKEHIKQQIDEIRGMAGGSTNMTDGIKEGVSTLGRRKADAKVMILLSDGAADFPESAERAALEATAANIQIFAVGIGAQYMADQLLKLVIPSNGTLFGSAELEKIKHTFEQLIGRIENFVATNASLEITFHEDVHAGLAYKASPEQAFIGNMQPDENRTVHLNVGNIERDKAYSFLFLATVPQGSSGDLEVCQVRLRYDVPSAGVVGAILEEILLVSYTNDRRAAEELNGEVMEVFRRVSITQLAERFVEASKACDAEQTAKYLKILIRRYDEIGDSMMKNHYEGLLQDLKDKGTITNDMLNASVVASTVVAGGGELPQVVDDEF